jgi:hypothetical protein
MRKKIFLGLLLLFILVGGLLGYAAYNAAALIEGNKPAIEAAASDALGADVALGDISATIFPTVRLTIDGVTVTNPSDESEQITLSNVTFHARLLPLLRRRLEVKVLSFDQPQIVMLMEAEGPRVAGLPRVAASSEETVTTELPFDLSFDRVAINDGTVTLRYPEDGTEYVISGLNLEASVSFDGRRAELNGLTGTATVLDDIVVEYGGSQIEYALDTSVITIGAMNAELLGSRFDIKGILDATDSSSAITITSDGVRLDKLNPLLAKFVPIVNEWGIRGVAKPDLTFALTPEGYSAIGTLAMADIVGTVFDIAMTGPTGTVALKANQDRQAVQSETLAASLNGVPLEATLKASFADGNARLEQVTFSAFSGTGEVSASLSLDDEMPFAADLKFADGSIQELSTALLTDFPMKLQGNLEKANAKLEGAYTDDVMSSMTGSGGLLLTDGLLDQVNLAKEVLAAIDSIPFVSDSLYQLVPERLRDELDRDYTILERVEGTFAVAENTLTTNDLVVVGGLFSLDAKGSVGFDAVMDLNATIYFNADFSAALAESVVQLTTLYDNEGRLAVPLTIKGDPANLKVFPDVSGLLMNAVKGTVQKKANELLDSVLKGDDSEEGGSEEESNPLNKLRGLIPGKKN